MAATAELGTSTIRTERELIAAGIARLETGGIGERPRIPL
jgi:hypothetical protein